LKFITTLQSFYLRYEKVNKCFPERVVVYRDGVGDGQIAQVKDMEVVKIKEAFKFFKIDPKFTYVIVSKRVSNPPQMWLNLGKYFPFF
jgi:hypothetical protein